MCAGRGHRSWSTHRARSSTGHTEASDEAGQRLTRTRTMGDGARSPVPWSRSGMAEGIFLASTRPSRASTGAIVAAQQAGT